LLSLPGILSLLCSRNPFSSLLSSLSEIYHLWTDCREDTAFGIVGCLAITRKRLPSGPGMHVTKQRLRLHGVHVTIF
jgi:hypothetical protein